jgi:hypothetical protein
MMNMAQLVGEWRYVTWTNMFYENNLRQYTLEIQPAHAFQRLISLSLTIYLTSSKIIIKAKVV